MAQSSKYRKLLEPGYIGKVRIKYEEVTDKGLIITTSDGERRTVESDTIATALPLKPDTSLVKSFEGSAGEIYVIGDCGDPNLIIDAVASGYSAAIKV